jgi:hypothetical protein
MTFLQKLTYTLHFATTERTIEKLETALKREAPSLKVPERYALAASISI